MADLASLLDDIRDNAPQPGLASLDRLVTDARATGLDVALDQSGDAAAVPAAPAVAVYRIVQEALTNTIRHAKATKVEVALSYRPDLVTVEVVDDGQGRDAVVEGHRLLGMRERVNALGGTFTVTPGPAGFVVRAEIPVAGSSL